MKLTKTKDILYEAYNNNYIVPAFNFENFELLDGIILGASRAKTPIIIQITQVALQKLGIERVLKYIEYVVNVDTAPIALHVDHVQDKNFVLECLSKGIDSIMFDVSHLDLQNNIQITKSLLDETAGSSLFLESELGYVGNYNDKKNIKKTELQEVREFLRECQVGTLGISVGNIHGKKEKDTNLDMETLNEISKEVAIPLVLHGCSGVLDSELKKIKTSKICKVNFETELRLSYRKTVERYLLDNPNEFKPRNMTNYVQQEIAEVVEQKCKLLGKYK